jgi:hypothetical protein
MFLNSEHKNVGLGDVNNKFLGGSNKILQRTVGH